MILFFISLLWAAATAAAQTTFSGKELLGRVTNNSVTVNMAADKDLEVYCEYGPAPGNYTARTATRRVTGGAPFEVVLDKLEANTRYYYRVQYRELGVTAFTARPEYTFQTQRPRGATFSFTMQFDPHMDENSDPDVYKLSLANQLADRPDFMIDLGDSTMSDKLQPVTAPGVLNRTLLLRSYYDLLCHSAPLFQALGNHEGEWGRNLNGTPNNVAVWNTLTRKPYFPNPGPDGFFSGDSRMFPLVGQRQSYYSFEWGDALFVVLDPYWSQPAPPELSGDWSLTLGREQYEWLRRTLENSAAAYKFVFAHNLVGGRDMNGAMRGGIETAKYLEWGGYNLDDSWGFDRARPGWPMPIHQLLVANNVTAFFHGHDHLYAKQDLDGIVYQEGPQPSARNFNLGNRGIDYSYLNGTVLGGTGYIRVQVSPTEVKAEYVQTWLPAQENATRRNRMVADTWTVKAKRQELKIASAASYAGGTVAPASIAAAFGRDPAGGAVLVRDSTGTERRAEVLGAAGTQVNFLVPPETAPGPAQVLIAGAVGDILMDRLAPGLFGINADGQGPAAAVALRVKADGSQSSELTFRCGSTPGSCANTPIDLGPASEQVYLSLYGTGLRQRRSLAEVIVTVGGERAEVLYAGPQPAYAGLDQVNFRLPRSLAGRGEVPVVVTAGGKVSNAVTIQVR